MCDRYTLVLYTHFHFFVFTTFGPIVQMAKGVWVTCATVCPLQKWLYESTNLAQPHNHFCRGHTMANVAHPHTLGHLYYWPKSGETDKSKKCVYNARVYLSHIHKCEWV